MVRFIIADWVVRFKVSKLRSANRCTGSDCLPQEPAPSSNHHCFTKFNRLWNGHFQNLLNSIIYEKCQDYSKLMSTLENIRHAVKRLFRAGLPENAYQVLSRMESSQWLITFFYRSCGAKFDLSRKSCMYPLASWTLLHFCQTARW